MSKNKEEKVQPVSRAAPKKRWIEPKVEILPASEAEATPTGASDIAIYS